MILLYPIYSFSNNIEYNLDWKRFFCIEFNHFPIILNRIWIKKDSFSHFQFIHHSKLFYSIEYTKSGWRIGLENSIKKYCFFFNTFCSSKFLYSSRCTQRQPHLYSGRAHSPLYPFLVDVGTVQRWPRAILTVRNVYL